MAGSRFLRADLHVHTLLAPGETAPKSVPTVKAVAAAARAASVSILGIADHNTAANVRAALDEAGPDLLVLPGIEISTADGHLVALFAPDEVAQVEDLARPEVLKLSPHGPGRSIRSMADLVREVASRGGLAIAAHIDSGDSLLTRGNAATFTDLLTQAGLAALEITQKASESVFSAADTDPARKQVWAERTNALGRRAPLARVMSSDAHSPEDVGLDQTTRTLTRLRLDDLSFRGVRAAIAIHPEARCKLEARLELQYPRINRARFEGGFLGGHSIELSPNLNCLIGGRGSGKSTFLRALQGVLGGGLSTKDDASPNMPDYTEVEFTDALGTTRTAGRHRNGRTFDVSEPDAALTVPFVDLAQDFGSELLSDDPSNPIATHAFLTRFLSDEGQASEAAITTSLESNAEAIKRTSGSTKRLEALREQRKSLDRSLAAATGANLTKVAEYARVLAAETPMLQELDQVLAAPAATGTIRVPKLSALAGKYGVDLAAEPASLFAPRLAPLLERLGPELEAAERADATDRAKLAEPAAKILQEWEAKHVAWEAEIAKRRQALKDQGFPHQVEELDRLRAQLDTTDRDIRKLEEAATQFKKARVERRGLLSTLRQVRDRRHAVRQAGGAKLEAAISEGGDGLTVSINWSQDGMRVGWAEYLGRLFDLRSPRKERLASAVTPAALAGIVWRSDMTALRAIGAPEVFFPDPNGALAALRRYETIFELETFDLDDRPEVRVKFQGDPAGPARHLNELSLGQLRSVLLGFLMSSPESAPLVLDQPEDQLDGPYVASTIVGFVHSAKERRQLIIATHNANLVVLGDAGTTAWRRPDPSFTLTGRQPAPTRAQAAGLGLSSTTTSGRRAT